MIDPSKSSTFNYVFCKSNECQKNNGVACISNNCHFSCDSADQVSCPNGDLATDTITLSSINTTLSLPNINFICGNNISSDFPGIGFVGLGHGSLSLISQMDHLIDGKFAYCLVPYSSNQSSKIDFGWKGVVEGDGAVSTPLIQNIGIGSYSVILEGITVGNKSTVTIGEINGAYIDTGTMLTYLPSDAYDLLQQEVIKAINQKPMEEDDTPRLPLCYLYTPEFNPPIITINLRGGNVELGTGNTFIRVTQDVVCFAFAPSSGKEAIIGNWQQMNFLVGYDLKEGIISFKPTDCSKY
ncbi:hypothetical protein JCGZ_02615 [Jatropha curcas]|uniref:Peptidase A1 domain-containing protein n=2 Tax=Jatropha curcas TaxID=180498 RepID=A0A067L516_JATCU|nr:hypothetical protein JCGZ_02615 [Jatropha curcas]